MAMLDEIALVAAKGRLALPGKNVVHGASSQAFDLVVRVEKLVSKAGCHAPPDGGLAGAHETDEVEIGT
jgi:hypothetical protein